jgi:hypothetical protein
MTRGTLLVSKRRSVPSWAGMYSSSLCDRFSLITVLSISLKSCAVFSGIPKPVSSSFPIRFSFVTLKYSRRVSLQRIKFKSISLQNIRSGTESNIACNMTFSFSSSSERIFNSALSRRTSLFLFSRKSASIVITHRTSVDIPISHGKCDSITFSLILWQPDETANPIVANRVRMSNLIKFFISLIHPPPT